MGTALKGMNRIGWNELTHAYGSAEAVPGRLSRVGGVTRGRQPRL